MSLEFIDGFDHYCTSDGALAAWTPLKWGSGSSVGPVNHAGTGRFGGYSFGAGDGSFGNREGFVLSGAGFLPSLSTRIMGFAILPCAVGSETWIAGFQDAGIWQVFLSMTSTGNLRVRRADSSQAAIPPTSPILATSSNTMLMNSSTWYYVQLKVIIGGGTTGQVQVNVTVGGITTPWINVSGVNTDYTGHGTANIIFIGYYGTGPLGITYFDDFYVCNSLGSVNNDFLGECRVFTQMPAANGALAQLAPSSGANYTTVKEIPPDSDGSYVSSATPGQIDLYTYPANTFAGNIAGVQVTLAQRKDDVGSRTSCVEYRNGAGGTNYDGTLNYNLGSSYQMDRQLYEKDPATNTQWTLAGVNTGQFGIKIIA